MAAKVESFAPHEYQLRALGFVISRLLDEDKPGHKGCGLWLEMGLGKTVVVLSAIDWLIDNLEVRKVLVVGPVRVVSHGWPAEIEKWAHTRWIRYSRILGGVRERQRGALRQAQVYLINYENLRWLIRFWSVNGGWPYDMVVFDESSKMKSPGAKRFQAFRGILQGLNVEKVITLTGTPADNALQDLWAPTFLLDRGASLGRTADAFRSRWFRPHPAGYGYVRLPHSKDEIMERIRPIHLSMRTKDYLTLPPLIHTKIMVDLPPQARALYDRLERELYAILDSGTELRMANAAVAKQKARQAANGALYLPDSKAWEEVHSAKLDALEDIIEEANGNPVLVGVAFHSDYDRILARFSKARRLDKDPKTIDKWNNNEIPILLTHPASAGYGLNLQLGGANIITHFSLPWSLGQLQQFVARLFRQGQVNPVFNHMILARDTVDEYVLESLKAKEELQDEVLAGADRGIILPGDHDSDPDINGAVLEVLRGKYGSRNRA
jgi:SNF2 family DNA or RNA helicase